MRTVRGGEQALAWPLAKMPQAGQEDQGRDTWRLLAGQRPSHVAPMQRTSGPTS